MDVPQFIFTFISEWKHVAFVPEEQTVTGVSKAGATFFPQKKLLFLMVKGYVQRSRIK